MAVTYSDAAKEDRFDAVIALIGATGKMIIRDSGNTVLAEFALANPAATVTVPVAGTVKMVFDVDPDITDSSANATGTAHNAIITDGTTTIISGLTVGTSGTDVIIDNTSITSGQAVTLTTGEITHG